MFRRAFAVAVLACGTAQGAEPSPAAPDPLAYAVLERLAKAGSPVCIAVASVEKKTRFAYGCTADSRHVTLDEHSLFEVGSITKGLTGLLLADMVLKGEVALDDPASRYSRPGAKLPVTNREITLLDLATHTSGLAFMPPGFHAVDEEDPFHWFDADALYDALARTQVTRDVGVTFEYSNFGFMWLSDLLARRAGQPFDVLLRERVLLPLGMTDAVMSLAQAVPERVVTGHDEQNRPAAAWHVDPGIGGFGGLRASVSDMARLAEALSGRRETKLDAAIALSVQPRRPSNGVDRIGLGWWFFGNRVVGHNGQTHAFHATLAVSRDFKRGAAVLADSAVSFDDLALQLVQPSPAPRGRTP